jgi:hypothetical protein
MPAGLLGHALVGINHTLVHTHTAFALDPRLPPTFSFMAKYRQ